MVETMTALLLSLAMATLAPPGMATPPQDSISSRGGNAPQAITVTIVEVDTWKDEVGGVKRPSPGNTKQFKATLNPVRKAKIKFLLSGVSKEKGTNLNTGDSTGFDLTFEKQDGFTDPAGDKQEIVQAAVGDGTATVTVTAHDYGAFGRIKAEVVEVLQEVLKPFPSSNSIPVLTDANNNNIEDAWDVKYNTGGQGGTVDEDATPEVNRVKGDWLSRYEEYRGFTVDGKFVSTSPDEKDWFYIDVDTIGQVGLMTKAVNGDLAIHQVKAGETNATYEINPNRGHASAHRQKATPITNSDQTEGNWGQVSTTGGRVPDNVDYCRVWVAKFRRAIESSEAVDATKNFIPVKENTNSGDEDISWLPAGRISLDNEQIDYLSHQFVASTSTLFAR
jgi:hypothetical protein